MKLSTLVIASSNAGKIREFANILPAHLDLIAQSELDIPEIDESGKTFAENAILKARNASSRAGMAAVADDSGLEVDELKGAPGIYSARYAGVGATDAENVEKLLHALKGIPGEKRTARFRCAIALIKNADEPHPLVCEGTWEGMIQDHPTGHSGFGYDPVFYVPSLDCSAAELDSSVKNRLSHRAQALNSLKDAIAQSSDFEQ